jgi:hypothetical protein
MQRTWNLYRDSNVSDELAVRRISEATVKARRLFDQSYVGAVSRVDKVCNNDSKFSIMLCCLAVLVSCQPSQVSLTDPLQIPLENKLWKPS